MANVDVQGYVQVNEDMDNKVDEAPRQRVHIKAAWCGVLSVGLVVVLLSVLPDPQGQVAGTVQAQAGNLAAFSMGQRFLNKQAARSAPAFRPSLGFGQQRFQRSVQGNVVDFQTEVRGKEGTQSFRRFFLDSAGKEMSPWHDMPLDAGAVGEYYMVTEIPKMTKAKMEIATKEPANPIAQDEKKGKLRDYHGPIYWNYGYLPQTWEDPDVKHPELNVFGDNDPVDVVEIGTRAHGQGELVKVKVLGVLAMIDDGELDWKMIAISEDDPMAAKLNDISDVESQMPGVTSGIREWFRWYKTPDGKPLNAFGFDEKVLDKTAAVEIIKETHGYWEKLRSVGSAKLWTGA
jgi:inorganic pyrophosphatase